MRFKTQELTEKYLNHMEGQAFANPSGRTPRRLTVRRAERDLHFKENLYPAGPQYYDDVWVIADGNMVWR